MSCVCFILVVITVILLANLRDKLDLFMFLKSVLYILGFQQKYQFQAYAKWACVMIVWLYNNVYFGSKPYFYQDLRFINRLQTTQVKQFSNNFLLFNHLIQALNFNKDFNIKLNNLVINSKKVFRFINIYFKWKNLFCKLLKDKQPV